MHYYSDFVISKNNFLKNPQEAIDIAKSLEFNFTDKSFPGTRTENIANSNDEKVFNFTNNFIKQVVNEIYPKIKSMVIDVRFHKTSNSVNEILSSDGWIHTDHELIAGLIYLNNATDDINSGTSICSPIVSTIQEPDKVREKFNQDTNSVDEEFYLEKRKEHNLQFQESIRIANKFNRLISYDSKLPHKPNSYCVSGFHDRLTLLFVISEYEVY